MAIEFRGGSLTIGPTALYPFTSFMFTSAGASGSIGPSGSILLTTYTASSSGSYFSNPTYFTTGSFQGYQIWTVPQTATYEIEVAGAASGLANYPTAAPIKYTSGAIIKGRVALTQGQKFVMVVGQRSLSATTGATSYNGIGGGGGSFFVLSGSNTPYLVAGGGGGMGAYASDSMGLGGVLKSGSLNGNGSTATTGSFSKNFVPGGTGSLGGRSHINTASVVSTNGYDGGGGGGFLGNGFRGDGVVATDSTTTSGNHAAGGMSFVSGSRGGSPSLSWANIQSTFGGFGGGGGGSPIAGGGGGGYAGGGGAWGSGTTTSDGAGGGGSYIISNVSTISTSDGRYDGLTSFSGSAITNLNNYNTGSGYILITKL